MHGFLNEIGIKDDHICVPSTTDDDNGSKRMELFIKEREEYGFDQRETWSLDFTAALWLYEHLKMYKKVSCVDLSYHRFDIKKVIVSDRIWSEKKVSEIEKHITKSEPVEMTQEEAVSLCCSYLEHYIRTEERQKKAEKEHKESRFAALVQEAIDAVEAAQAFHIFAELMPAMWW